MQVYSSFRTGEVSGSATSKQLPSIDARMIQFCAPTTNVGNVYIGGRDGVTIPNGTTTATAGVPLSAGTVTPLLPALNLDNFSIICDNASDSIVYMAVG